MKGRGRTRVLLSFGAALWVALPAAASFHRMELQQAIGGVNGDTTAQAIQLRMRFVGEHFLNGQARLVVFNATGGSPVLITNFPLPNPNPGQCLEILITSAGFAAHTNPPAVADYTMTNLIPASYLAAGSIAFQNLAGNQTYARLSFGGASYTGSDVVLQDPLGNDDDGHANPPVPGPLPSTGAQALLYQRTCNTQLSTTNAADYSLTAGPAVFKNNDGASFTVIAAAGLPVPALSPWGATALALALAVIGSLGFRLHRRRLRSIAAQEE